MHETLELVLSLLQLSWRVEEIDVILENLREPQIKNKTQKFMTNIRATKGETSHETPPWLLVEMRRRRLGETLNGGCSLRCGCVGKF